MSNRNIIIQPINLLKVLLACISFLTITSLAGVFSKYYLGYDHLRGIIPLFNLAYESNIPTWFSSVILLVGSIIAFVIASQRRQFKNVGFKYWYGLSAIFLYLSVDEAARLHESLEELLRLRASKRQCPVSAGCCHFQL